MNESFPEVWKAPGLFFNNTHYIVKEPSNRLNDRELVTFILIHGIGSCFTCFNPIGDDLCNLHGFRVIIYDLIGRGFSKASPNGKYDADSHVNQLYELLQHLQSSGIVSNGKVHLVGHSMGGAIATLFTSKYSDSVLTLTVITPAGLLGSTAVGLLPYLGCFKPWIVGKKQLLDACHRDFVNHTGKSRELESQLVKEMSLMADNNPDLFPSIWYSLLQFPLNDISKEITQMCVESRSASPQHILVIWAENDLVIPMNGAGHFLILEKHSEISSSIANMIATRFVTHTTVTDTTTIATEEEKRAGEYAS
jgi:pimeloyl-ACP methyl ester carboxylesterase